LNPRPADYESAALTNWAKGPFDFDSTKPIHIPQRKYNNHTYWIQSKNWPLKNVAKAFFHIQTVQILLWWRCLILHYFI